MIGGLQPTLFAILDAPILNTNHNFGKVIMFKIGKRSSNYASGNAIPAKPLGQ
jgi:hypothetical protein